MQNLGFPSQTTLTRIEPHRLRELLREDLQRHPNSSLSQIRERIGMEIPVHHVRKELSYMENTGVVVFSGSYRWRTYRLAK